MDKPKLTPKQKKLVEDNIDLAHYLALEVWRKNPQEMERHDVISVAYIGLVKAAQSFDPSLVTAETLENGKAFSGYARLRINGSIVDWQRSRDHVPRRIRSNYKDFQRLGWGQGRSADEIAQLAGMDGDKVRSIIQAVEGGVVSIDHDWYPQDATTHREPYQWNIWGSHNVETSVLEGRVLSSVGATLEAMPELNQLIVVLRYYAGHELSTIAQMLDLRLSMVRDIHQEAVLAIHEAVIREAS